MQTSALFGAKT